MFVRVLHFPDKLLLSGQPGQGFYVLSTKCPYFSVYLCSDEDRLHIDTQNDDLGTQSSQGHDTQSQRSQGSRSQDTQESRSQSQEEPESQPLIFSPSSDEEDGKNFNLYGSFTGLPQT